MTRGKRVRESRDRRVHACMRVVRGVPSFVAHFEWRDSDASESLLSVRARAHLRACKCGSMNLEILLSADGCAC